MSPFTSGLPFSAKSIDVFFVTMCSNMSERPRIGRGNRAWFLKPGACAIVMVPINEDHLVRADAYSEIRPEGINRFIRKRIFFVYDHGVNDCSSHWIRNFALIKFPLHTLLKKNANFHACCCPFPLVVLLDRMFLSFGCKPAQAYAES